MCVCGHHFDQTGHQPGVVANSACGQLNREEKNTLSPFAPENLISRFSLGFPIPRQPAHSPLLSLNLVLWVTSLLPPALRFDFHQNRQAPSGQSRVYLSRNNIPMASTTELPPAHGH